MHVFKCLQTMSVAVLLGATSQVAAQTNYPTEPVRLIAPFAPGGAADTVARIITPGLTEALQQPVVVENRSGAGGSIGSSAVASAEKDGHTLLVNLGPPHQTVHLFNSQVQYDPVADFTAIALLATAPQVLVVPASSPFQTAGDFLEAARETELTYGTSGMGTSQHLAGLLLTISQDANLVHIGYRSGAEALTDVLGGQTDAGIVVLSNVLPHIKSGQLRALGVLESRRARSAPDIPTIAEAIGADFSVPETWVGLLGPADLPAELVDRLYEVVSELMEDPQVIARLETAGYEPRLVGPEEFGRQLAESEEAYRSLVTAAGIEPQ